jgi:V8-like Glu-specific endopeptidase
MVPARWAVTAMAVVVATCLPAEAEAYDTGKTRLALFVVGGTATKTDNFPATGELAIPREFCTGTAVGTHTVLTAAHCIDHKKPATIKLGGKTVKLTCWRHPDYKPSGDCAPNKNDQCTADVALCKAEAKIDLGNAKYEVVQTKADAVKLEADIVMVGYGCTADNKKDHGVAYTGKAKIGRLSTPDGTKPEHKFLITIGGAVTCGGDSGSGAFDVDDAKKRFLIAVSSARMKGGDGTTPDLTHSMMVQVTDKRVVDFLKKWGDDNKTKICGIHADAAGCR